MQDKMSLVRELIDRNASPDQAARKIGRTVAIHESMPFAVYAFLTHPDSFEACLYCAALNGGDRDTLGAMACAISGAYLGVDRIPASWAEKLENRSDIERLASGLAEKLENTSSV
jgi:poly(ADP-ribose) glycohydrolase ARH3